jgi:hypothetical protein
VATITVKAPQGYPVGTAVDVFTEPSGDVSSKGKGKNATGVVAADGSVTITGLAAAHYQVGATVNGVFRSFLAVAR